MLQLAAKPSKPPGGRRVADAEVQRRLSCVERLLANGVSRADIVAEVGLPARTTDSYIARVRQAWQESAQQDRESARASALGRLLALRERMLDARAWGPLVRVEQLICDLQGLRNGHAEPVEIQHQGSAIAAPDFSAEALRERAPLLVQACARIVAVSGDSRVVEQTRAALSCALSMLDEATGARSSETA